MAANGSRDDPQITDLRKAAAAVGRDVLARSAQSVDRNAQWPEEGLGALAAAKLTALHVPAHLGGLGQGMYALAVVSEELARHCGSTAMCFSMHSIATAVLAAKATPAQEEKFLRPIAEGRHICSLALSEPGTGAFFFLPRVQVADDEEGYCINGEKSFVTSGGHADSYVLSAVAPGQELDPGSFTCLAIEAGTPGLDWGPPWDGYGMRGNSSRGLVLRDVRVDRENLLGAAGDQIWYVFEVIAPYFLIAMSSVYLGIAQAALDLAVQHIKGRSHVHTGETLSVQPVLWHEVAQAWIEIEATRQLIRHAARLGDAGDPGAPAALFSAKAKVAEMVTSVTDTALVLTGGRGYGANADIARCHRDARAAGVMSPTTHLLKTWLGRSLLDLPLL